MVQMFTSLRSLRSCDLGRARLRPPPRRLVAALSRPLASSQRYYSIYTISLLWNLNTLDTYIVRDTYIVIFTRLFINEIKRTINIKVFITFCYIQNIYSVSISNTLDVKYIWTKRWILFYLECYPLFFLTRARTHIII